MEVTFRPWEAYNYAEVWRITEYREGAVYGKEWVGYCDRSRRLQSDGEIWSALAIELLRQMEYVTIDLLE